MMTRFNQRSYKVFSSLEQLLLKGIEGHCYATEMQEMKHTYGNDVDTVLLTSEIGILKTILKGDQPRNAAEVVAILKECDHEIRLIPNVMKIAKLLLVNGATSTTPERSFSTARRLKTWLRSTMSQKKIHFTSIVNHAQRFDR